MPSRTGPLSNALWDLTAHGFRLSFRILGLRIDGEGAHHVPSEGPVVLVCNHVSYIDFAFAACCQRRRRVRFMIRRGIMRIPVVGRWLTWLGQIEVDPYGDPGPGYAKAVDMLRGGEVVGVFPEGTISPSFVPMAARTGAARMALETGATILPVAVWGSQRIITKGRPRNLRRGTAILVRYGAPFRCEPGDDPRAVTEELMARITILAKEAQGAYPQRPRGPDDTWWLPAYLGGSAPTVEQAEAMIARQNEERRKGISSA